LRGLRSTAGIGAGDWDGNEIGVRVLLVHANHERVERWYRSMDSRSPRLIHCM